MAKTSNESKPHLMKQFKFISTALSILSLSALSVQAQEPAAEPAAEAAHAAGPPASFATCVACHQATGLGIPNVFPPLAGSEWVNGPVENLIRIQLRGLMGPITVKGQAYNSVMPPNSMMSDKDIAEVLTYVRSTWGNKASAVTPDMVKALRSEVGKPMLKAADLIDPNKPAAEAKPKVKKTPKVVPATEPAPATAETPKDKPKAEPMKPKKKRNNKNRQNKQNKKSQDKQKKAAPATKPATAPTAAAAVAHKAPASYTTCLPCHQATGLGLEGAFPPLAGSEWVNGPVENLIRIQLRGLEGPIEVAGKSYSSMMPANSAMSDDQIAEVLTYVRSAWGNKGSAVTPDMVKALRSEVGKPMLKASDLLDPNTPPPGELKSGTFKETEEVDSSLPGVVYLFFGLCLIPVGVSLVSKK